MNLFEVFDKTTEEREYYRAKRPVAVILTLLGLLAMCLCTPAGATYLESWLLELMPFGATPAAWLMAIGFDLTFAYLLSHLFCDIFAGMDNRRTYWDIPTMLLVVLFGGVTLAWSFWGGDMRKAKASKQIAEQKAATIDSAFHAVASMTAGADQLTKTRKGMTRQERKNNEAIAAAIEANTKQTEILGDIAQQKIEATNQAEIHRHNIIENGKLIILGAYLFLIVTIGCVEYIKSKKQEQQPQDQSESKSDEKQPKSGQKQHGNESKSIGFFGNSEGHILNETIAYKKADGTLKYYKAHQLSSMIYDAQKKGKDRRVERLQRLREKLINA